MSDYLNKRKLPTGRVEGGADYAQKPGGENVWGWWLVVDGWLVVGGCLFWKFRTKNLG